MKSSYVAIYCRVMDRLCVIDNVRLSAKVSIRRGFPVSCLFLFLNSGSCVTGEKVLPRGVHKAEIHTVIFLLQQELGQGC